MGANETGEEGVSTLVLMPNPTKGPVTVRFRLGVGEPGRLWVVNLRGGVVEERSVVGTGAEQRERLDLDKESAGVYLIRLQGEHSGTKAGKLVLER